MTTGFEFAGVQVVALSNLRQCRSAGVIVVGIAVDVDLAETLMGDHGAAGGEGGGGACGGSNTNTNLDGFAGCVGHLGSDRALPDQFIHLGFALDTFFGHGLGQGEFGASWADSFVRFLRTLRLLVVRASLGRAELFAVLLGDDLAGSVECVGRQRGAIGTHVRYKALFVQGLGGTHGH